MDTPAKYPLRIMSILDDSAPHDLRPVPTFSANAESNLPHM